jgi:hypothetical protein
MPAGGKVLNESFIEHMNSVDQAAEHIEKIKQTVDERRTLRSQNTTEKIKIAE